MTRTWAIYRNLLRLRLLKYRNKFSSQTERTNEKVITNLINELHSLFALNSSDGRDFLIVEQHTVEFISSDQHLGSEGCRYELASGRERLNHGFGSVVNTSTYGEASWNSQATAVRYCASRLASIYIEGPGEQGVP